MVEMMVVHHAPSHIAHIKCLRILGYLCQFRGQSCQLQFHPQLLHTNAPILHGVVGRSYFELEKQAWDSRYNDSREWGVLV